VRDEREEELAYTWSTPTGRRTSATEAAHYALGRWHLLDDIVCALQVYAREHSARQGGGRKADDRCQVICDKTNKIIKA
jgi:hypothetical protein